MPSSWKIAGSRSWRTGPGTAPAGGNQRERGAWVLLAALHIAGLATLTHTPSPMGFLASILDRPKNEKPFLLIPVGYPAPDAVVPTISKRQLDAIRIRV